MKCKLCGWEKFSDGCANESCANSASAGDRDLLPCPRCGSHAVIVMVGSKKHRYQPKCFWDNCFILGSSGFSSENEAIKAWNTRWDKDLTPNNKGNEL